MKNATEKQNDSNKKPSRLRYIIPAAALLLLITPALVFMLLRSKPDQASEKIIREIAGEQLNKDPNSLTDEDFMTIKKLDLSKNNIYDIRLLKKFTNLEELDLSNIPLPVPDIPKWMVILGKLKVINLYQKYYESYEEKYFIDLSPLENLSNLKKLYLRYTAFKDLKLLAKIKNLQEIEADAGLLYDHGLFKYQAIGNKAFTNFNEFKLESGYHDVDSIETFPKIKVFIPSFDESLIQNTEIRIKSEVDKVMK